MGVTVQQKKILVCIQQRHAPNPVCCANHGSRALVERLQQQLARSPCAAQVSVVASGCMGMCLLGPNVKLMPDGKVWNAVRDDQVDEILAHAAR